MVITVVLIIDNFDSFTHNLAQLLGVLGCSCMVRRTDALTLSEIESLSPRAIVISPGPGRPRDFTISCRAVERFAGRVPLLGVCLGHQCICEVFGGRIVRSLVPVHGKTCPIYHDGRTLFQGLRNPLTAARYHSLVVSEEGLPREMEVSAFTADGEVMGVRAPGMAVEGLQFHPESIATPQGMEILGNFLGCCSREALTGSVR